MNLTFHGAARQVTGSMHLLTLENNYRILLDCGMDYELKNNPASGLFRFPFNPQDIDVVILTHAHVDHSGNLPALVAQGFSGYIYCTPATATLTEYLLYDSANIQLMEYRSRLSHTRKSRQGNIPKPLFGQKEVKATIEQMRTMEFDKPLQIQRGIEVTLIEAGHLLGAACVKVNVTENNDKKAVGFTGDLGRKDSKLVNNPRLMKDLDALICECTYGGRKHKIQRPAEEELLDYVRSTCVEKRGKLIVPAFSVGRTQSIVFTLNLLKKRKQLPDIKIFVDSPLAIKSTSAYQDFSYLLNDEAREFQQHHPSLFEFENTVYIDGSDEHNDLMTYFEPCIIISAAGMVEGGRIQEHVMNHIENPNNTILIAGFCAEGTLGHRLLQGQPTINIKRKDKRVRARIAQTDIFSSHPDGDEVYEYITGSCDRGKTKVFLVHGEETQLAAMQERLFKDGFKGVECPRQGQEFVL